MIERKTKNISNGLSMVFDSTFDLMYPGQKFESHNPTHRVFSKVKYAIAQMFPCGPSAVDWIKLCDYYEHNGHPLFCLCFLTVLLKDKLYCGSHSESLYALSNNFVELVEPVQRQHGVCWAKIFCGDKIDYLNIIPSGDINNNSKYPFEYILTEYNNIELRLLFASSLASIHKHIDRTSQDIIDDFECSLGTSSKTINSYCDFNESTFWTQINYYMEKFKTDSKSQKSAIVCVYNFYRFLVNAYPSYSFFKNATRMTDSLLFSTSLLRRIQEGFYFTTFNPHDPVKGHTKVLFILRNFELISTQLRKEDWFTFDISKVNNFNYQEDLISYLYANFNIGLIRGQLISYICDALCFLLELKSQRGYPNPNPLTMTNQEAVFIGNLFNKEGVPLGTKNNQIGAIRRFLQWESDTAKMSFDNLFFSYLSQYEEPSFHSGQSISERDLVAINNYFRNFSSVFIYRLAYVIFHLALQTEFRIAQICHLTVDCIKPSIKPNQHIVYSNSKTSHGKRNSYIITGLTHRLLMDIINETEELREKCSIDSNRNYIFLYQNSITRAIGVMNTNAFDKCLKDCSKEQGWNYTYSAKNLRDTHMTKAFEYILRNGKSDTELSILSKHKHIDTTKNHYIQLELEKMLEATYGIIIGNTPLLDVSSKIVKQIPASLNAPSATVENGCGSCTAECCTMTSSLPCLACEHFITTEGHEKYFIKAIEGVDLLIEKAKTQHDKDDLNTIKTLYVLYLKAINKHREMDIND